VGHRGKKSISHTRDTVTYGRDLSAPLIDCAAAVGPVICNSVYFPHTALIDLQ